MARGTERVNPLFANGPLLGHYIYYVECQRATFGPPVWFQILSEVYCDVKHIFPKKIICQQEFVALSYFHKMYNATEEKIKEYCQQKFHNVVRLFFSAFHYVTS